MDAQRDNRNSLEKLLTVDEVAALLKVPKSWVYERTRRGTIPHLKLGKYLRFPLADLLFPHIIDFMALTAIVTQLNALMGLWHMPNFSNRRPIQGDLVMGARYHIRRRCFGME